MDSGLTAGIEKNIIDYLLSKITNQDVTDLFFSNNSFNLEENLDENNNNSLTNTKIREDIEGKMEQSIMKKKEPLNEKKHQLIEDMNDSAKQKEEKETGFLKEEKKEKDVELKVNHDIKIRIDSIAKSIKIAYFNNLVEDVTGKMKEIEKNFYFETIPAIEYNYSDVDFNQKLLNYPVWTLLSLVENNKKKIKNFLDNFKELLDKLKISQEQKEKVPEELIKSLDKHQKIYKFLGKNFERWIFYYPKKKEIKNKLIGKKTERKDNVLNGDKTKRNRKEKEDKELKGDTILENKKEQNELKRKVDKISEDKKEQIVKAYEEELEKLIKPNGLKDFYENKKTRDDIKKYKNKHEKCKNIKKEYEELVEKIEDLLNQTGRNGEIN